MSEFDPGETRLVRPGEGERFWQPVPANGFIEVKLAPRTLRSKARFALGTQTVPPGSYVREHAHDRVEEVIHVLQGRGKAVVDGESHPIEPGVTLYLGLNRRHMFVNDGDADLTFLWLVMPEGLEDFFEAIGRPVKEGEPDPTPFPRPADVLEIERRTVFAALPDASKAGG